MRILLSILLAFQSCVVLASEPQSEPTINQKKFSVALQEGIIKPFYDQRVINTGCIIVREGLQYENVLAGYLLETRDTPTPLFTFKTSTDMGKCNYSFEKASGQPALSKITLNTPNGPRLHNDSVAKNLLEDTSFLKGLKCPSFYAERSLTLTIDSTIKLNNSVLASRGPISMISKKVKMSNAVWFRTPTGIRISPPEGVESFIKQISIFPWRYVYRECNQEDLSWTTVMLGEIDFVNSIVKLTVQNAHVDFLFNNNLIPEGSKSQ